MFIDFTSLIIDDSEGFSNFEDFYRYASQQVPSVKKPVTVLAESVIRFEPSVYDEEWTDVFLDDGDILTAEMTYQDFKVLLYTALDFEPKQTWEMLPSKDGLVNIRFYKN